LAEHPETGAVFNRFMTMQSKLQNAAIVANYDFSEAQTVVDVEAVTERRWLPSLRSIPRYTVC